jgi:hypothetical protein
MESQLYLYHPVQITLVGGMGHLVDDALQGFQRGAIAHDQTYREALYRAKQIIYVHEILGGELPDVRPVAWALHDELLVGKLPESLTDRSPTYSQLLG